MIIHYNMTIIKTIITRKVDKQIHRPALSADTDQQKTTRAIKREKENFISYAARSKNPDEK